MPARLPFSIAVGVWVRVALQSFGGPAGQIAVMHRILVEEKRWVTEQRFLHALNYCMLLPGPEAQQLATYLGWVLHGTRGALVAGSLFVLPGFLAILALSVLYVAFADVTLVQALFYGLKPAVVAVVLAAVLRIGRRALRTRLQAAIAAAAFLGIFFFALPFPAIVLAAGVVGLLASPWLPQPHFPGGEAIPAPEAEPVTLREIPRPRAATAIATAGAGLALWLAPLGALALALGRDHVFVLEGVFFSKAAVVTFGGAYAVLAYVAQQAVEVYGWLQPGEMLDGLGMAETTPGPLIQVVQFVGFLGAYRHPGALDPMWAGLLGSVVTTWVTFAPCFLFILVGAPFIEHLRGVRALDGALSAITAAVVGVIVNLGVWFGLHVAFGRVDEVQVLGGRLWVPDWATVDPASLAITAGAILALLRFRAGLGVTLAGAAGLGILYRVVAGG